MAPVHEDEIVRQHSIDNRSSELQDTSSVQLMRDSILRTITSSSVLLLCLICAVASSLVPVAELFPPKLYKLNTSTKEKQKVQHLEKVNNVKSSYGIINEQGIKRLMEYVHDKGGFRIEEKAKGTGSAPLNIAGIKTLINPKTVDAKGTESPMNETSLAQFEKFYKNMADVYKEVLASGEKDFFKDAILATKMKEKEAETDDSEIKLDLLALYKLGLILPKFFEMYSTKKGVITQASIPGKLDYLKFPELDEFLLLSLFNDTKGVSENYILFNFVKALMKLNGGASKFEPRETKRHFSSFGKDDMLKDHGDQKGLKNINRSKALISI